MEVSVPKYKVLRPIEHNGKLYLPSAPMDVIGAKADETAISGAHGNPIPVDSTGVIELTDKEAAPMTEGQVEKIVESQRSKVKSEK